MAKSMQDIPKKKRGRPKATGRGEGLLVRFHTPQLTAIDAWIARQADVPSRPEAVRRLVGQALAAMVFPRPVSKEGVLKAAKLAEHVVEKLADKSQPLEEQQRRKRHLIKGPKEFRELRGEESRKKR